VNCSMTPPAEPGWRRRGWSGRGGICHGRGGSRACSGRASWPTRYGREYERTAARPNCHQGHGRGRLLPSNRRSQSAYSVP
jgi:hypothetical protein